MAHTITLIPGDGIGPEVTQAAVRILEATGLKFEWETFEAGADAYEKYHEYIPRELIESIERTRVGLKGPVTTPIGGGFASINVELRKKFELYPNFRPIRNLPHIPTRYPDVDEAADAARRDRVLDRPGGRRRRRRAGDRFPCRRPLPRVADAAAHGSDAQRPAATGQEVARAVRNAAGQNRNVAGIGMTSQRTRARMVERLREQGIRDERVLGALGAVPRHLFVEEALP